MLAADYSKIASTYDKGRLLSEENINLWLEIISKYSMAKEGAKVLDLGCGTGRFAIPMATKLQYAVTGADASKEMLVRAKKKDTNKLVKWELQDAQNLTYQNNSFDMVFTSHLIYHVKSPAKVIENCARILRNGGTLIVRYATFEQINDDVVHAFFPEANIIDETRFPKEGMVEKGISDAGFKNIRSEKILQKSYQTGAEHLDAIKLKNVSALTMIRQEDFKRGINNLEKYIEKNPNDPLLLFDKQTITVGYKK